MKEESGVIESLIKGGLIGAAMGALLSKDKEDGAVLGAILGAAVSATLKANEEAKKTNLPVYVEEEGNLYEIDALGNKHFIRTIKKPTKQWPDQFKLI